MSSVSHTYISKWYHDFQVTESGISKFNDGKIVHYKGKQYYVWYSPLNNSFQLCERIEDVRIKTVFRLRRSELDDVTSVEEWRDEQINKLGI